MVIRIWIILSAPSLKDTLSLISFSLALLPKSPVVTAWLREFHSLALSTAFSRARTCRVSHA